MTIRTAWQTLLISVSALFAIPSGAAPIIDAAAVKVAQARGAIVWDVRATPLYRKGHIPGAVSIGDAGNALRNPVTEDFIETALVENILGNLGYSLNEFGLSGIALLHTFDKRVEINMISNGHWTSPIKKVAFSHGLARQPRVRDSGLFGFNVKD